MVYALDGKTDGYIAIQTQQDKSNTIFSAYNINKTFEGTTRIMEYEEIDELLRKETQGWQEANFPPPPGVERQGLCNNSI